MKSKNPAANKQGSFKEFVIGLKSYSLTPQQIKTLRGQALAGDLAGARKGLERIIGKVV